MGQLLLMYFSTPMIDCASSATYLNWNLGWQFLFTRLKSATKFGMNDLDI